ncbi:MAG: hypothetical protein F6K00_00995 [Leptolyngbya sp. SIOISBB]|nr:hypothetical protein [Leptolyngbya sp. SIOISBB]
MTQLTTDLAVAGKKEAALDKQVKGLQEDLNKQQERLFELKDTLEKAQKTAKADANKLKKVTKELEEAKTVILKMTEAAETIPEPEPAPVSPPPTAASPELETKPALAVKLPPGGGDIYRGQRLPAYKSSGGDIYHGRRLPAHKNIPDYAIDHGEQKNKMLSDEEIGWVD